EAGRSFFREFFGDALELLTRHTGDALDFLRRILFDLLADVIHAVDALLDKLLVFPAVLEDMPEHSPQHRYVRARTYPHIFAPVRVIRGSQTMKLARLSSLPSRRCCRDTGCASAGLPPRNNSVFELRMSV